MNTSARKWVRRAPLDAMILAVSGICLPALAAARPVEDMFDSDYLLQVAGSLFLVFGCLFGLIFVLKKINPLVPGDGRTVQVLGSAKVGAREKIMLVRAGEKQLLVGVAAGSVRTLLVFDELPEETARSVTSVDFSAMMRSPAVGDTAVAPAAGGVG